MLFESAGPREMGAEWRRSFTGRISIEIYKRQPSLVSDYEEREDFIESFVLSFHSDRVDPKFLLAFSSALSPAGHDPYSPAPSNGVRAPSMTSDTIA